MKCSDYQELLSAYLDRALPTHEQTSVAGHLESCMACRADLAGLLHIKEVLRGQTMPPIPPELIAAIEAQTVLGPSRWTWIENVLRWGPLTAATLALAVWAFAVFQNVHLQMQQPRVPLQAILARAHGQQWSLDDDRRVAVHHVTESDSATADDTAVPSDDSMATPSESPPQP